MKLLLLWILIFCPGGKTDNITENNLFFLSDDSRTVVGYDAYFKCHYADDFCALVYYVELDNFRHDDVHMVPLQCGKRGVIHQNTIVQFKGGDGWRDNFYEPAVIVFHDCTIERTVQKFDTTLPIVSVHQRWTVRRIEIPLLSWNDPSSRLDPHDIFRPRYIMRDHYFTREQKKHGVPKDLQNFVHRVRPPPAYLYNNDSREISWAELQYYKDNEVKLKIY
ncbi:unnamed protein product [Caenorhabditis nigoni]|uniref:ZP domain-containing protein n=1 Tax=Caenorhabditis nigoni TaxID=1611254 RepID=A0A2G5SYT5_9PELO|nr:hypothetical protein B9Z55_025484 [Caenorhabditis nigoni]